MAELLFEIGTEEMPARFLPPVLKEMAALAGQMLKDERLENTSIRTMGTPRRMTLIVEGLIDRQPDVDETLLGPPVKNAFDANGQPTRAAQGFAKGQGVDVSDLKEIDTEKGPRVGFVRNVPGRPTLEVLSQLLPDLVHKLSFPKTMRWGNQKMRFARPIHWLVAILDGQVLPFRVARIKTGDQTRGHRFMAPEPIQVKDAKDYQSKLEEAFVILDPERRREMVAEQVEKAAAEAGGRLVPDEELLTEVSNLVELPVACKGGFDQEFLEVPRPVIISAMRSHQRYFALEDTDGNLLPAFVAVNNTRPKDLAVVAQGHERVLRARLADARFFLDEDTKEPLINRLEELKTVTYHAKLGTSFDKVERFTKVAAHICRVLGMDESQCAQVERACRLCKCDLVTEMVGEFPDLQGQVGADYALKDNEDPVVAQAVYEHYLPSGANSPLPQGMIGLVVGLADRLDTLCGCFGVGLKPSGAADPYGLRRAALAILRNLTEKSLRLSLNTALDQALETLEPWLERPAAEVKEDVKGFIAARFQGLLTDQGVPTDVAQAVLAAGMDDLYLTQARAKALAQVKDSPEFKPLAVGMKRVMNILRKEKDQVPSEEPSASVMTEQAEKELHKAFLALRETAAARFADGDYVAFLQEISALKGPIDQFFDQVLVMDKDEDVRKNRLALLSNIAELFAQLAEFTQLQLA
ncbi:glycine--tRNA ligase subunit beta [Dethiosulfatarculus sandiegensis]|uniref:Glycine--tRNA ligase beta subunit n=1 Tax=Dethiosulfatarculus sandiegensis TaxID=1429043 RepID=A0A0D2J8T9_9BACT|nr:glycine--tRNA ligase subunit beta [Dethiosulfatarculus sandiegensis]KIX14579.1 glycyl-tRNA synthetase subunit beta [Dethiosulfatarculus sandiegensis]